MTAPDRDPLTIAREVIRQHGHLDRDALSRREKERLILARAVAHVRALAERLDAEAVYQASRGDTWDAVCLRSEAGRIRDALNSAEKEAGR